MGDALKKVQPGQKLSIPAAAYNAFIDTTLASRTRQFQQGATPIAPQRSTSIVRVKNNSGAAVGRFGVLGIDSILFTPTDNADEFRNQPCLVGVKPAATHAGQFVLLIEPLENGVIGRAVIDGLTVTQLKVGSESDQWAEVIKDNTMRLGTGPFGSARIVYKESGTGDKWGLVRLGDGASGRQFWGVVVCQGPNGEADFTDNRYWVKAARISNAGSSGDSSTARATFAALSSSEPGFRHVAVTNLFEDCGSHYVRPATPVRVSWDYDQSTPPQPRYLLLVADEGTCKSPCTSQSGSSGSISSSSASLSSSGRSFSYSRSSDSSSASRSSSSSSWSSSGASSSASSASGYSSSSHASSSSAASSSASASSASSASSPSGSASQMSRSGSSPASASAPTSGSTPGSGPGSGAGHGSHGGHSGSAPGSGSASQSRFSSSSSSSSSSASAPPVGMDCSRLGNCCQIYTFTLADPYYGGMWDLTWAPYIYQWAGDQFGVAFWLWCENGKFRLRFEDYCSWVSFEYESTAYEYYWSDGWYICPSRRASDWRWVGGDYAPAITFVQGWSCDTGMTDGPVP